MYQLVEDGFTVSKGHRTVSMAEIAAGDYVHTLSIADLPVTVHINDGNDKTVKTIVYDLQAVIG